MYNVKSNKLILNYYSNLVFFLADIIPKTISNSLV